MTVYVDDMQAPFGRMIMCHLFADSVEELHEFALLLRLKRSWFQDKRVPHYDLSKSKREQALRLGAREIVYGGEEWMELTGRLRKPLAPEERKGTKRTKGKG